MRRQRTITTADVARRAGLSKMTVSRVLNEHPYVSEQTRKRVLDAVHELGFTPNALAKRFFTGRTQLVALIIPLEYMLSSFYFKGMFQGVLDYLGEHDYDMMLHDSNPRKVPTIEKARELVRGKLAEGLLIAAPMSSDDYPCQLTQEGIPVVVMGETVGSSKVFRVGVPNRRSSADAVRRLTELGHRRIGMLAFGQDHIESQERFKGYEDALRAAGLALDRALVGEGKYRRREGFDAACRLLQEHPDITALFAANAEMAVGALEGLRSLNLQVPRDVSLVAFDDCADLQICDPPVSTVRQLPYQVGFSAARMLLETVLPRKATQPEQLLVETEFIERSSMASPGPGRGSRTP